MKDPHCPSCGTPFVRVAQQAGAVERVLNRFHVFPFRCQLCMMRFRAIWKRSADASREFDRREFKRLPSSFQAKVLTEQSAVSSHRVTDISMVGCTLETTAPYQKGMFLELTIKPASNEEAIKVDAAMVCSVRSSSLGVRFLEFHPEEQRRLSQVVLSLLVSQTIPPSPFS